MIRGAGPSGPAPCEVSGSDPQRCWLTHPRINNCDQAYSLNSCFIAPQLSVSTPTMLPR